MEWESPGFWKDLKEYLGTLKKPEGMHPEDFQNLRRKSANSFIQEGLLMRKHTPMAQLVISNIPYQSQLLRKFHKDLGHSGLEETYQRLVC
jgi:hypothetical protein